MSCSRRNSPEASTRWRLRSTAQGKAGIKSADIFRIFRCPILQNRQWLSASHDERVTASPQDGDAGGQSKGRRVTAPGEIQQGAKNKRTENSGEIGRKILDAADGRHVIGTGRNIGGQRPYPGRGNGKAGKCGSQEKK